LTLLLASIAFLVFIVYPFAGNDEVSSAITNIFLVIMLFSGIVMLEMKRSSRLWLIGTLLIIMTLGKIGEMYENNFITRLHLIGRIIVLWMIIIMIFLKVFREKPLSFLYRISGSVTVYLLVGFIWANMYFIVYNFRPDAFYFVKPIDNEQNLMFYFMYFSFEILTTLGFGDILPVHPLTKTLVILEAVIGPLYLAVTIGRLISKISEHK